jgi:small subunit ribosomal protein S1
MSINEEYAVTETEEATVLAITDLEPGTKLKGSVKQVQLAGAIIDVGLKECDAVLHISQIRRKRVNNVQEFLEIGQNVTVWVLNVDKENARLNVSMIKPPDVNWEALAAGQIYEGKVVRIEKFGVFVDIGAERPGLVHISELAHGYVKSPEDVVEKGQTIEVKVVGVNRKKRQIDLSAKIGEPEPTVTEAAEAEEELPTAMALAMQRALADSGEEAAPAGKASGKSPAKARSKQDEILRRALERHQEKP